MTDHDLSADLNEHGEPYPVRQLVDERRFAPAVREWSSARNGPSRLAQDRTALARQLYRLGVPEHEIADVLGVHWALMRRILSGGAA